jgi:hypothetical protein
MNKSLQFSVLTFAAFFLVTIQSFAQSDKIFVTQSTELVSGLIKLGEVKSSASKVFGKEIKLRKEAIELIKEEAFKMRGTVVLVQSSNFTTSPVNTVSLTGIVYTRDSSAAGKANSEDIVKPNTMSEVIFTNNLEDVKKLTKIEDITVRSSKVFMSEAKLTAMAKEKLKEEAALKGYKVVLIQSIDFSLTPVNTVTITGTGYKQ